eukprot:TRINITY_DN1083_c0_g1_i2.p1 TRINITY_DN1083_c0_g1~~TRINITY_DN1083_c0_g1_i2.p1  ORF type:complete len:242 (+),score=77.20 TRINITY_DN1083_c0_g1_i2:89-814(+)
MAQPAGHTRIPSRMPVYYAASLAEAEQAMQRISGAQVVAIDLEWKPNWGGGYNRTATVQLCDGRSCVVLHVFHMRRTPAALAQLLSDPAVLKVGAGISQDVDRVRDDLGVQLRTIADIQQLAMQLSGTDWYCEVCRSESTGQLTYDQHVASKRHTERRQWAEYHGKSVPPPPAAPGSPRESIPLGLKKMAAHLLGAETSFGKKVPKSNWQLKPLSAAQLQYAAEDAALTHACWVELSNCAQ